MTSRTPAPTGTLNLVYIEALVDSYATDEIAQDAALNLPRGYGVVRLDLIRELLAKLRNARGLLVEGHELSMSNQRAARMRHRLVAWGDRAEVFLETVLDLPDAPLSSARGL